ncbi:MAG TPA: hypothetical protein VKU80_13840 [Planctomycetota bacterium]|nr:hypothetical protein [Planctomycetota bacterium]
MSISLVDSEASLAELLASREAIVFVQFNWSGQSVASLRVFEEWEKENAASNCNIPRFFRIDPDMMIPSAGAWFTEESVKYGQDLAAGGYGSVIWLRSGRIVDFVKYAAKEGASLLRGRSMKAFSRNIGGPDIAP